MLEFYLKENNMEETGQLINERTGSINYKTYAEEIVEKPKEIKSC